MVEVARPHRPRVVNGPLIKPREPNRSADLSRLVVLGLLLALPAFLYAGLQARLLQHGRTIVALEGQQDRLEEQRQRLELELATLRDPRRIVEVAGRECGLVPVGHDQIVYLTPSIEGLGKRPGYVADAPANAHGRQRP
ncbi:MAG: hypothetical protein ACE5HV_08285 [Acidobacteriota bacterium]